MTQWWWGFSMGIWVGFACMQLTKVIAGRMDRDEDG
jgi:hypothetical protein